MSFVRIVHLEAAIISLVSHLCRASRQPRRSRYNFVTYFRSVIETFRDASLIRQIYEAHRRCTKAAISDQRFMRPRKVQTRTKKSKIHKAGYTFLCLTIRNSSSTGRPAGLRFGMARGFLQQDTRSEIIARVCEGSFIFRRLFTRRAHSNDV